MIRKKIIISSLLLCCIISGVASIWYSYQYSQLTHQPTTQRSESTPADQALIMLTLALYFFLVSLIVLLGISYASTAKQWWIISYAISLLAFLGLLNMWNTAHHQGLQPYAHYVPIESEKSLEKLLEKYGTERIKIPTGIFIEHLAFLSSGSDFYPGVVINGYVWQRYKLKEHDHIKRGFIFSNVGKLEVMKKLYQTKTDTEEIICWQFTALLFQRFDASRFPFDHQHNIIQILHPEFMNNIILIPDFQGYNHGKNPKEVLGHSNLFYIPHWKIDKSFFSFHIYSYDEDFSLPSFKPNDVPQLNYYFISERNIIDSALIYLIMLFTATVILFIALLSFLKHKRLVGLLGFSTLSIIGVGSGLLFVLISTHSEIRKNLGIDGTAYIEYLFAIVYIAIIGITINSIIFTLKQEADEKLKKTALFSNNFLIKILYWPSLLTSALLVTAYSFY